MEGHYKDLYQYYHRISCEKKDPHKQKFNQSVELDEARKQLVDQEKWLLNYEKNWGNANTEEVKDRSNKNLYQTILRLMMTPVLI